MRLWSLSTSNSWNVLYSAAEGPSVTTTVGHEHYSYLRRSEGMALGSLFQVPIRPSLKEAGTAQLWLWEAIQAGVSLTRLFLGEVLGHFGGPCTPSCAQHAYDTV